MRRQDEDAVTAARRCVADADHACLPVQGPPGSGKTHTGALAIVDLVGTVPRRRVAITALSHRAISQLVQRVCVAARQHGVSVRIMQKSDERGCDDPMVECVDSSDPIIAALADGSVDVVAGTPWLLARPELADQFDTLVVDEAGQLSLASVVAAAPCARNLVLLGDPQQLEQPSQGSHPPGAAASALGHVLDGAETIPADRGLFLDLTWRMHPDVCEYISANFYDFTPAGGARHRAPAHRRRRRPRRRRPALVAGRGHRQQVVLAAGGGRRGRPGGTAPGAALDRPRR